MLTAEIRWFFDKPVSYKSLLRSWSFSEPSERIDYYLLGTGERLGVKWREGKMEAKQQQGESRPYTNDSLGGAREVWKKWSFALAEEESYAEDISAQPRHWLAVRKQRQTAGFAYDSQQQRAYPVAPGTSLHDGCSLEVTYGDVAGRPYTTLGLEAFGDEASLPENLISTIDYLSESGNLVGLDLSLGHSSNYARWIHANFSYSTS